MSTLTAAPGPRTEHPDYVRTRAAREAAYTAFEDARTDVASWASVIADDAVAGALPHEATARRYREAVGVKEAARAAWREATDEWRRVRADLGFER